jgi:hypothetical protein
MAHRSKQFCPESHSAVFLNRNSSSKGCNVVISPNGQTAEGATPVAPTKAVDRATQTNRRDNGDRPVGGFKTERWNYERTDFYLADQHERCLNHPEVKAITYQPGVHKTEYKHRAIRVCLEACGAD